MSENYTFKQYKVIYGKDPTEVYDNITKFILENQSQFPMWTIDACGYYKKLEYRVLKLYGKKEEKELSK